MTTLKLQIENIDWTGIERESEQECAILDRKMAPNGCGAEFLLVEFFSKDNNPFDCKGLTVVILDEGFAEIERQYVKSIFDR